MNNGESGRLSVFVSYSHKDERWLDRLKVHLRPLETGFDIEVWDDTKIRPGDRWKIEIAKAVEKAKVAVLIISADFLASDFIRTDELPPLLKAAEEEGALVIPILASPCLFLQNPSLAQFQAANTPSRPLVSATEGEQEEIFLKVAEQISGMVKDFKTPTTIAAEAPSSPAVEDFLDQGTWTRLISIGDWIFDMDRQRIIGSGVGAYLLSRQEYGDIDFTIRTTLQFSNFPHPTDDGLPMNSGILFGWKEVRGVHRYYNLKLDGQSIQLERVGFNGGTEFADFEHLTSAVPLAIDSNVKSEFEISVHLDELAVAVDGQEQLKLDRPTGVVGRVGLRPWRSQLDCTQFVVGR